MCHGISNSATVVASKHWNSLTEPQTKQTGDVTPNGRQKKKKTEDTKSTMTEVISGVQNNIMFLHFVLSCQNISYRWQLHRLLPTTIWTRIFCILSPAGLGRGVFSKVMLRVLLESVSHIQSCFRWSRVKPNQVNYCKCWLNTKLAPWAPHQGSCFSALATNRLVHLVTLP